MTRFHRHSGLVGLLALALLVPGAKAELIAHEGFDYTAGTLLATLNGGSGWGGAWYNVGNRPMKIHTSGLTYSDLNLVPAPIGNAALPTADDRPGANRLLQTPIASGTVYVSALIQPTGGTSDNNAFSLSLGSNDWEANRSFGFQRKTINSVIMWQPVLAGTRRFNETPPVLTNAGFYVANNSTNLLVAKVDMGAKAISVYVNPTSGEEPGVAAMSASFTASQFKYIGFYGWSRAHSCIDEIRLAATWDAVLGIVRPPSATLIMLR